MTQELAAILSGPGVTLCGFAAQHDLAALIACGLYAPAPAKPPGGAATKVSPSTYEQEGGLHQDGATAHQGTKQEGTSASGPALVEDTQLMYWLMNPGTALNGIAAVAVQKAVLPAYSVRVPSQDSNSATAAARSALRAFACARALRDLLRRNGLWGRYMTVESQLLLALARAEAGWVMARSQSTTASPLTSSPAHAKPHSQHSQQQVAPPAVTPRHPTPPLPTLAVEPTQPLSDAAAWAASRLEELRFCLGCLLPCLEFDPLSDAGQQQVCRWLGLSSTAAHPSRTTQTAATSSVEAGQEGVCSNQLQVLVAAGVASTPSSHSASPSCCQASAGQGRALQVPQPLFTQSAPSAAPPDVVRIGAWLLTMSAQLQAFRAQVLSVGEAAEVPTSHLVASQAIITGDQTHVAPGREAGGADQGSGGKEGTSGEWCMPACGQPHVMDMVPQIVGPEGLLLSAQHSLLAPAHVSAFTDLAYMPPEVPSCQQLLEQAAAQAVAMESSCRTPTQPSAQMQEDQAEVQQALQDAALGACREVVEGWASKHQLILFDNACAAPITVAALRALGLVTPESSTAKQAQPMNNQVGVKRRASDGSSRPAAGDEPGLSDVLIAAPAARPAGLRCGQAMHVMLFPPQAPLMGGPPAGPIQLPEVLAVIATWEEIQATSSYETCYSRPEVLLVGCNSCWLHQHCSGPGSLHHVLQQGLFTALHPVRVYMGGPASFLAPWPPGAAVVLRVRLEDAPLVVLAHLTQDVHLRAALSAPDPWEVIGQILAAGGSHLNAGDQQQQQAPQQAHRPLRQLMQAVGGACSRAHGSSAWVAQQLVAALVLGDAPKQAASRLQGGAALARGPSGASKAAAKELLAAFLVAFPRVAAHRAALLEGARREGCVAMCCQ